MATTSTGKRRKTGPPPSNVPLLHINDLPHALLTDVATYLPKPSRAFFAVAMTAPASSWREKSSSSRPSLAAASILKSTQSTYLTHHLTWENLDMGDIEKSLAGKKLTDDDICATLLCINTQVRGLKILKLTGCTNITGSGLEPLSYSMDLQQIDLSLVGYHASPRLESMPSISEAAVLPILRSIIDWDFFNNHSSLRHIQLPAKWREDQSTELAQFLEIYNRHMEDHMLCCSKCSMSISHPQRTKWYIEKQCEWLKWFGLQNFTCCKCIKHFCDDHEDEDTLRLCTNCERDYCTSCVPVMKMCEQCNITGKCKKCGELSVCEGCQQHVCELCLHTCESCNQTRCEGCKPFVQCEGEGCVKAHCEGCFDGVDYEVKHCEECEISLCFDCRHLESRNSGKTCSACMKFSRPAIRPQEANL